jgi:hypothetical protein
VTFANNGASSVTRVNFAVPLPPGKLSDAALVRVAVGDVEVPRATRGLAPRDDGSFRSVQIQIDIDIAVTPSAKIAFGEPSDATILATEDVATTLLAPDGEQGPRVYTLLPRIGLV